MPNAHTSDDWKAQFIAAVDPRHGLWRLVPAPLVAAVHFTALYISTSVYCLRAETGDLGNLALELWAGTAAALALIVFCVWAAWRRLRLARKSRELSEKRRDEVLFLARITLYLANLSWVGVLFLSAPLFYFKSCA